MIRMEMTGVAEAAQFISVSINGAETILKLTGSFVHFTGHEIKELMGFLVARHREYVHNKELKPGEVKLADLMSACSKNREQIGCIQIDERLQDEFVQYCTDNGLSYSFLLDVNKQDTYVEAVYRGGQAAAFEPFLASRYPLVKPYSLEEYRHNATIEGFAEAEQIIKDCEQRLVPVPIDKGQITGVSEKEVEVCVSDNDNVESFVIFPRDRLRVKDNEYVLAVADNDFIDAYDKSAFAKNESGNIVKLDDGNRKTRGKVKGEYVREMVRLEYARCINGKHTQAEKTYVNKKTKDVMPAGRNKDVVKTPNTNIIEFPDKGGKKR